VSHASRHAIDLSLYDRIVRRRIIIVLALIAGMVLAFVADLMTGPANLALGDVLSALIDRSEVPAQLGVVVWDIRLPCAVMALLVGAALALSGAEMQTVLNNPLASPFTLGVSSAAAFGAALAIVVGLGIPGVPSSWIVSGNAFLFALGSVLLLQMMARLRGTNVETLVLFGIALVFSFNALVAILQFIASQEALQQLVFWSMGSLTRATWEKVAVLAVVIAVVLPWSLASSWQLTALRLGEDRARSFGVNVTRLRFASLLRVSLLAATAVAFVGTIGFVGLVGPHIARLLIGEDHRFFLPTAALSGALIMSLASVASKLIVPGVLLPAGIITSMIGVPVFLALIFSGRGRG